MLIIQEISRDSLQINVAQEIAANEEVRLIDAFVEALDIANFDFVIKKLYTKNTTNYSSPSPSTHLNKV